MRKLFTGQDFAGTTGATTVKAAATASGVLTLPASTDTLVGKATTDIFTNKTLDTAGVGNVLRIGGVTIGSTGMSSTTYLNGIGGWTTPAGGGGGVSVADAVAYAVALG